MSPADAAVLHAIAEGHDLGHRMVGSWSSRRSLQWSLRRLERTMLIQATGEAYVLTERGRRSMASSSKTSQVAQ